VVHGDNIAKFLTDINIVVQNNNVNFTARVKDIFSGYYGNPKESRNTTMHNVHVSWIRYYRGKVNFAVWCASAGCGVGIDLMDKSKYTPLIASLFRFHIMYQPRRILKEMDTSIPGDRGFIQGKGSLDNVGKIRDIAREFDLNLEAPSIRDGLGGGYAMIRQYTVREGL